MVVRHITGQAALPQNQIAEQEVKDPSDASKQHRNDAHIGHLQPLAQLKQKSAPASQWSSATHAATRFASTRSKRDAAGATGPQIEQAGVRAERSVPSTAVAPSGTSDTDADNKANTLRDAQQAFEKQFPNVPKPVDLNKIYVNTYEEKGNPPTGVLKSSDSLANYILKRSNAGEKVNFGEVVTGGAPRATSGANGGFADVSEGATRTAYGIFSSPTAVDSKDEVRGTTPQAVEAFINGLPASGMQRKKIAELESLSGQANTVFEQKPRPSPLEDAREAFEAKFPKVPKPVDLSKLYINAYRQNETPPGSGRFTREWVMTVSVADYIKGRYTGGGELDLRADAAKGIHYGVFSSPDVVSEGDEVEGATASEVDQFIKDLPANQAKDVKVRNDPYFSTPGQDGKTPQQHLGEIRQKQIETEAQLQYADGTLSEKGRKLVESVTKNPTQAELERAYPNEGGRPRVYTLKFNSSNNTEESDPDEPIRGPIVMMTAHADDYPGEKDVVVVYLPGQGILEFDSLQAMKDHFAKPEERPKLLGFVSEWTQAKWPENVTYGLGTNEVPAEKNLFEYSVEEQIKKQHGDTEYRLTQARERGADQTELDGIAGSSSDDLSESFDAEGVLQARDLRLIEQNRPEWWKTSSKTEKDLLESDQRMADQLESRRDEIDSKTPTLKEHAAQKIKEELQAKYPDIDPDKVTVTIKIQLPPEGPTRANPNPKVKYQEINTTLTEYVLLKRRASLIPEEEDTGLAGAVLGFMPGSSAGDLIKLLSGGNHITVSATMTDADGNEVTLDLDKAQLNALTEKLNVGESYRKVLDNKLDSTERQAYWKAAYQARMKADLTEAELSGKLDKKYDAVGQSNYKLPSRMVQAVLDAPDSKAKDPQGNLKRKKVDGHIIQTEEFTINIWGKGPHKKEIRESYPVNGVLVISAVDDDGSASRGAPVVLYTPDAPDGIAYRTFASREEMTTHSMFKQPEWIEYFQGRVSNAQTSPVGGGELTRKEGVGLYAQPKADPGSLKTLLNPETRWTTLSTKTITGEFMARLYDADASMERENADAGSVTNEELNKEWRSKLFNGVFFLTLDAGDIIPFGKIAKGLKALARQVNPRKFLSRLPEGAHLITKPGGSNTGPFGIVNPNTANHSAPWLKNYEVPNSRLKNAKYVGDGVYAMGANQYIRIGNKYYPSKIDANRRIIFNEQNSWDHFEVTRVGDQWVVLERDRVRGGTGGRETTSTESVTIPRQPNPTLRLRHPDRVRLDNLVQNLSSSP
ncbi:dermonecrotic toxin domain-containing protein, partial [Burkholderia sp. AW49-1]